jgi:hypothetical protein
VYLSVIVKPRQWRNPSVTRGYWAIKNCLTMVFYEPKHVTVIGVLLQSSDYLFRYVYWARTAILWSRVWTYLLTITTAIGCIYRFSWFFSMFNADYLHDRIFCRDNSCVCWLKSRYVPETNSVPVLRFLLSATDLFGCYCCESLKTFGWWMLQWPAT